jgi:hypothetical protein
MRSSGKASTNSARLFRRQQQVHMVAHQYVCVQLASEAQQHVTKTLRVALAIRIVEKARQSIVASLHHVLGNSGQIEAGEACHVRKLRSRSSLRPSVQAMHPHQPDTRS